MRTLLLMVSMGVVAMGQPAGTNYDEAKVPAYKLPELLVTAKGERVRDAKAWTSKRRGEILSLLEKEMYGKAPGRPDAVRAELVSIEKAALGGKALRKEVAIRAGGRTLTLLMYTPAEAKTPVPVFLGLNFNGNHAATAETAVRLASYWDVNAKAKPEAARQADEKTRGASASRWSIERIIERGYGVATIYYGDIEPDFNGGMKNGVRGAYIKDRAPAQDEWAAVAAWAWGLSRAMDYLEQDKLVDGKKVAVMGHSRLGKAALWAGAMDERFAMVISNNSGEGGAAISRRKFGETVKHLNERFPHWFAGNYRKYSDREEEMPFDSHMILSLIAPRPLYIASAQEDQWADPKGEFLAGVAVGEVYALFGKKGVGVTEMPAVNRPVGDAVGYHVRTGKHDVTAYDWEQWLNFADRHLKGKR